MFDFLVYLKFTKLFRKAYLRSNSIIYINNKRQEKDILKKR